LGGRRSAHTARGPVSSFSSTAGELRARAHRADAVLAFMPDRIDGAFADACLQLKVVAVAAKGIDNFDAEGLAARGIWLTNVPDLLTEPTAELALGLALSLIRNIGAGDRMVRMGRFAGWRPVLFGATLDGAMAGIVGMGAVGVAIARRLRAFGASVRYTDPAPRARCAGGARVSFDEVLAESDIVFLATPLTAESRNMIDAAALTRMRADAFLVNVGRGSVVDELAVAEALAARRLAGYAADVFAFEDWALDERPREVPDALLAMSDRTVFTPHLGSAVDHVRRDIAKIAAQNIVDALAGRTPRNAVNAPVACPVPAMARS
jgi:phosphonate dehydrogenase